MDILESPNDVFFQEDLENIVKDLACWERLREASVLITGATGLVGSQLVKTMACLNRIADTRIQIYAQVRDLAKAERVFGELLKRGDIQLFSGSLESEQAWPDSADFIIHTASPTASKFFITNPVETLRFAIEGTIQVLEFARKASTQGVVYLSSMEAFGRTPADWNPLSEEDLGYINHLDVRSSYSEGKRACECLCAAYASEYGVRVMSARLAQTFGAGVDSSDSRVFAQFTRSALKGEDLVLHTKGLSVGNYCYTSDAVRGILLILTKGQAGEVYTVVNGETSRRIVDVAQLVSDTLGNGKTKVVFDIPEDHQLYGYAPDVEMRLSSAKLRRLGWTPYIGLREMFERLASSFMCQDN